MEIDREKFLAVAMALALAGQAGCGGSPRGTSNIREESSWGGSHMGRAPAPTYEGAYYPPPAEGGYYPPPAEEGYYPPPAEEYYAPPAEYAPPVFE